MRLRSGTILLDRYQISSTLGRGASATTYLAHDLLWDSPVALKLLRADSPELLQTLRIEFDVLRGLSHPNLSNVHDFAYLPNKTAAPCFYTCDPIDGAPLHRFAKKMVWKSLRVPLADILHALHHLHSLQIRHGDVKPPNILVRNDGRGVLIDLGCARPHGPCSSISGTPSFMAPELLKGSPADGRADLFAFGKTLETLKSVLDIPPEISTLMGRLLHNNPDQRPSSAHEVLEAFGFEPCAQTRFLGRTGNLIGRDQELNFAQSLIEARIHRRPAPRILWLRGEEGVGKSRLLREIKWNAQKHCRVVEANSATPHAVHDVLARAWGSPIPAQDVNAVLHAREQLERADDGPPLVLLMDDAHRLSEGQAEALRALMRTVDETSPLLLILSSVEPAPPHLVMKEIELGPLDEDSLRTWFGDGLPRRSFQSLVRLSGGFPSSVRGLLDQMERGELGESDLDDASSDVALSERRVQALGALPIEVRRALGVLVLHGNLSSTQWEAHGLEIGQLEELIRSGFAVRDGGGFRLRRLTEGERLLDVLGVSTKKLHLQVAQFQQSSLREDVADGEGKARLVYHLARGGKKERALEILLSSVNLHEAAPRTWKRAVQAVIELEERWDLELLLARLEQQSGESPRAMERLQHLLNRGGGQRVLIHQEIGACSMTLGDVDGAIVALEQALAEPGASIDQKATVSFHLARAMTRKGEYRRALTVCESALAEVDSPGIRADLLEAAGVASSFLGDSKEARSRFDQAVPLWNQLEEPRRLARAQGSRALVEYRAGNLEQAAIGYEKLLETAESHGLVDLVATAALNLGTLYHQQGNWVAALESYERGMRMAVAVGQAGTETILRFNLAKLYADIGQLDRAENAAQRCVEVAVRAGQPLMEAAANTVKGELAAIRGDFDVAETELQGALTAFQKRGSQRECAEILVDLAEIALQREDFPGAETLIQQASLALKGVDARDVQARVDLGRARVGLATNRPRDALALAEGTLRTAGEIGQRNLEAEAHLVLASFWESQGSILLARKHRGLAQEIWEAVAARLSEPMRATFWNHPRRISVLRASAHQSDEGGSRREQKLQRLIEINKRLNSSHDVQQVLTCALDAAIELTGAERGFVLLDQNSKSSESKTAAAKSLRVAVARNLDREQVGKSQLKFSRAIAERVLREGQPVITIDARDDMRFRDNRSVHAMQLQSVACVPVQSPAGTLGALYLDNRFRPGTFTHEDVDLLLALADQVALALENARLLAELVSRNEELDKQRRRVEALAKGQAAEIDRLTEVVRSAQRSLQHRYDYSNIVGASPAMQAVFDLLDRVIETSLPVLVQGESGTGKELVARAVHYQGPHREGPLVSLNCAAVPESLIESELFGYVKGAFTGADRDREGLILKARGGTLFLDELGELPLAMQVKLLRVLQEREVRPLGAARSIPADFRLVSATNRKLMEEVQRGAFREDLFYRISVIELTLPPLRDRLDDIPELARRLLDRASERTQRPAPELTAGALRKLMGFHWPGNVRQLENVLLRASVLTNDPRIRAEDIELPDRVVPANVLSRDEFERREVQRIADALSEHRWNVARVARVLSIPRPTLYRKLRRYGLVRGKRGG